jgi:cell fate regulator YaaT (PSP1 superfamily)
MTTVTAVRLRYNPKSLWLDPNGTTPEVGDHVLVETNRGREVGMVVEPMREASDKEISRLSSPLRSIIRVLGESDYAHLDELDERGREAMAVFREHIEKHGLEMRPVLVEFLFSGDKATFYFTSEGRVDFRELIRDLAAYFHMRIDMRQIGSREEARMVGGLAHCGEEICCARLGGEFGPVSIRMAKEQDLPLNPVKISGACGRLMCCLRYEFEAYKDFKQRSPKRGTMVETPLGSAKVTDYDTPREVIHMRFDDNKELAVPLRDLECEKDEKGCITCCRANRETLDRCASSNILLALSALDREIEQRDFLSDTEARPQRARMQARRRKPSAAEAVETENAAGRQSRDSRRKRRSRAEDEGQAKAVRQTPGQRQQKPGRPQGNLAEQGMTGGRKLRRTRGGERVSTDGAVAPGGRVPGGIETGAGLSSTQGTSLPGAQPLGPSQSSQRKVRPGHNSSGLRNPQGQGLMSDGRGSGRARDGQDRRQRRGGNAEQGRDNRQAGERGADGVAREGRKPRKRQQGRGDRAAGSEPFGGGNAADKGQGPRIQESAPGHDPSQPSVSPSPGRTRRQRSSAAPDRPAGGDDSRRADGGNQSGGGNQ